jgi:hypothetical protein
MTDKDKAEESTPIFEQIKNKDEARSTQFPSLNGQEGVEVAERTADSDETTATVFSKVFVVPRESYENGPDQDEVHARNMTAVRQFMVSQGLRPSADVTFVGEEDYPADTTGRSVALRYEVPSVPAAVASAFEVAHVVIPQDGPDARANKQLVDSHEDRVAASHAIRRVGTPEENADDRAKVEKATGKKS